MYHTVDLMALWSWQHLQFSSGGVKMMTWQFCNFDLFSLSKWPFQRLSDLKPGDNKVTAWITWDGPVITLRSFCGSSILVESETYHTVTGDHWKIEATSRWSSGFFCWGLPKPSWYTGWFKKNHSFPYHPCMEYLPTFGWFFWSM